MYNFLWIAVLFLVGLGVSESDKETREYVYILLGGLVSMVVIFITVALSEYFSERRTRAVDYKNASETERVIGGVKYVARDAEQVWSVSLVPPDFFPSCWGCAAKDNRALCQSLPKCRKYNRRDGRDLIFVEEEIKIK